MSNVSVSNYNKRTLIVGGSGFIGRNVSAKLNNHGVKHKTASRKKYETSIVPHSVIEGEAIDNWRSLVQGFDTILFLAHPNSPYEASLNPPLDISFVATFVNFLEACRFESVRRIIYASSGGTVYGPQEFFEPIYESAPTNPISVYGITKLMIEKYLLLYKRVYGIDATILRLSNPYGPKQSTKPGFGVIPHFIRSFMNRSQIVVYGGFDYARDFVYVDDVASAIHMTLISEHVPKDIYNISSGVPVTVEEIFEALSELSNFRPSVRFEHARPFDLRFNVLSNELAAADLQWYPHTTFAEGLRNTWIEENAGK